MNLREMEERADLLERKYDGARLTEQRKLRPDIERIIRTLTAQHQPIPRSLKRLETKLEQEDFDDMFDNMPV